MKAALGLSSNIDLLTVDLIAAASGPSPLAGALDAQKAAASIAKILDTVQDNGGDTQVALQTLSQAIQTTDLDSTSLLTSVYQSAGVPAGEISPLVTQTQQTLVKIEQASSLGAISNVQAGDLVAIIGGNGKDTLTGSAANERIEGKNGNDILNGNAGSDLLLGGNGDDTLSGGLGNDVLVGGKGAERMNGGDGADIFVFAKGDSASGDVIQGFTVGTDKIFLAAGLIVAGLSTSLGSTFVNLSDGGSIKLENVIGVGDYQSLLIQSLPLWGQSWAIA